MKHMWLLAALISGCVAAPDPRDAHIVVQDPELDGPTDAALAWWKSATHDVVSEHMPCADRGDKHCVLIRFGTDLPEQTAARTYNFRNRSVFGADSTSVIVVRPDWKYNRDELKIIVAHELGHAMWLPHTQGDQTDLMYRKRDVAKCITWRTLDLWRDLYGDNGKLREVCADGIPVGDSDGDS